MVVDYKLHGKHKRKISTEMYLKTIFLLKEEKREDSRPVDVVKKLNLAKGTVSEMLKKIKKEGLIEYESYGKIRLTDKGLKRAKNVIKRYVIVKKFLSDFLKNDSTKVHDEACELEHGFSDESIDKLDSFMKSFKKHHNN